jgi:hypothetical protein
MERDAESLSRPSAAAGPGSGYGTASRSLIAGEGLAQVDACCDAKAGDSGDSFGICGIAAGHSGFDNCEDVFLLMLQCAPIRCIRPGSGL